MAAANLPVSCTAFPMDSFPPVQTRNFFNACAFPDRDENRRRNRLDHFVGLLRAPVQSGGSLSPRTNDNEVVDRFRRLLENLPNWFARSHNNLRCHVVLRGAIAPAPRAHHAMAVRPADFPQCQGALFRARSDRPIMPPSRIALSAGDVPSLQIKILIERYNLCPVKRV